MGIILSASWTIASNVLTLAGVGTLLGYNIDWRWFTLGGFIVFSVFMGWIVFDHRRRILELEQTKPSIEAYPQCGWREGVTIKVKNNGAEGNFQAQVEVIDTTDLNMERMSWLYYKAYWDGEADETAVILKGMTRFIKLATFEQGTTNSGWLRIYRMAPTGMQCLDTHHYPILSPEGFVIPEVCLKVTIGSTPSAKEGPIELTLRINASGTMEVIPIKKS